MRLRPRFLAHAAIALTAPVALAGAALPATSAAEPARSADSFVDSVGVNTHTSYDDTVYGTHFDLVRQRLAELGVRHVRDGLQPGRPDQYERLNALAADGVKATLILGEPEIGAEGLNELFATLRSEVPGAVEAVEGPNEVDMDGDPGSLAELAAYQSRLHAAIKSDPALAALPVLGPSLVHRSSKEGLGDISGSLDYGNIHSYPGDAPPEQNLARHFDEASSNSGGKPLVATETGYHTAVGWNGEHDPVSERAMATYLPRLFLDYFRSGVSRTFSYELVDQGSSNEREASFGLLRNDFSEKPAFATLRDTIAILSDPGPEFSPGALDYRLGGDRSGLRDLLLQKRDGSFYLALWRESAVWDGAGRRDVAVAPSPVRIESPRGFSSVQRYQPRLGAEPLDTAAPLASGFSVAVGADVAILRLVPESGALRQGRIQIRVSRRHVPVGGRLAVRGRLPKRLAGRSRRVTIQQWRGKRGWRTIGRSRTRRSGAFRKRIRVRVRRMHRASRVRVVARVAKPSRAVRVRIRR